MVTRRAAAAGGGEEAAEKNGTAAAAVSDYEQIRARRIKENMARLQGMGIFDLTRQLNSFKPKPPKRPRRSDDLSVQAETHPSRRSSRYGENVIEANQNPDWIYPVCRGICNCSLCLHGKELMQNNFKQELDGHLVGKEEMIKANFLDSEHVPAEDVVKQDAATIFVAVDSDSETKKQPRMCTRTSNVHVAAEDICKQDPTADEAVDCQTKKGNVRDVRVALADLGILDAAGDNVNGESKIQ